MISAALLLLQLPVAAWGYRQGMIRSARSVFGPAAPIATLAAQIHAESAWQESARSWVGAQGLSQFMPATAAEMARRYPGDCAPANPMSARWAFACRDRYLHGLLLAVRPLAGSIADCSRWALAFRAYNGGLGWVVRDRRKAQLQQLNPDDWRAVRRVNAGRSAGAFTENVRYPERIYRLEPGYAAAGWGSGLRCLDEEGRWRG